MGSGIGSSAGKQINVNYAERHKSWMDTCICFGQNAINAYTPGSYPMANTNIFCEKKLAPKPTEYLTESIRLKKGMSGLECPSPLAKPFN